MDYHYQVDPRFARPGRPAYDAEAGYLDIRLQTSVTVPLTERIPRLRGFSRRRLLARPKRQPPGEA